MKGGPLEWKLDGDAAVSVELRLRHLGSGMYLAAIPPPHTESGPPEGFQLSTVPSGQRKLPSGSPSGAGSKSLQRQLSPSLGPASASSKHVPPLRDADGKDDEMYDAVGLEDSHHFPEATDSGKRTLMKRELSSGPRSPNPNAPSLSEASLKVCIGCACCPHAGD